jgi:hypothetical protein
MQTTCCIYRRPKTLELCKGIADIENRYCRKHNQYANIIYEILYDVLKNRSRIDTQDVFKIFKYIHHIRITNIKDVVSQDDLKQHLFLKTLDKFPREQIYAIYKIYYDIDNTSKMAMINELYRLNYNTYKMQEHMKIIYKIQKFMRNVLRKTLSVDINGKQLTNNEDPFTYENISDIPNNRVFAYYDALGHLYAFDVIELEYFIRKCLTENTKPYNPYTREVFSSSILYKIELLIWYNQLEKKNVNDEYQWETELQAFTDLSIEIERCGFYNSPDWFMEMNTNSLLKVIKLFKDFSADISESFDYFVNYNKETFKFDFCKEGIKLFKECNEDKFILCCNFMKALGLCSNQFYRNTPNWLSNTYTASRVENLFDMLRNDLISLSSLGDVPNRNSHNFLLYYYVEHMQ